MADFLQRFLGGAKSAASSVSSDVDDFADFATAASPAPPSHAASSIVNAATNTPTSPLAGFLGRGFAVQDRPFTRWYRIWERVTIHDFYQELVIIPILIIVVLVNLYGSYVNKQKAKQWAATHLPMLQSEFASVGFGGGKKGPSVDDVVDKGLAKALESNQVVTEELLRQKAKNEYFTYATGRQNVAYLHVLITLHKRYNPVLWLGETMLSFFFDSIDAPKERVEATAYPFDGQEKTIVQSGESSSGSRDSSYDGFVWAIVHKDMMKELRDARYDLSLTSTKDHAKLPEFVTVMSESAEISEALLTPDLIKAVNDAGEDFEALIVSDQPIDAPRKLNDTVPRKRVSLSMKLNPKASSTSLFQYFLRMPDQLVSTAHFRAEAMRRVKTTREEEMRKIRKADEDEKAEERKSTGDKLKKEERERKLKNMSAEEQRKFLDREKQQDQKKMQKKRTMRA